MSKKKNMLWYEKNGAQNDMSFFGGHFFRVFQVWENLGKIPSHAQKFACSFTYESRWCTAVEYELWYRPIFFIQSYFTCFCKVKLFIPTYNLLCCNDETPVSWHCLMVVWPILYTIIRYQQKLLFHNSNSFYLHRVFLKMSYIVFSNISHFWYSLQKAMLLFLF